MVTPERIAERFRERSERNRALRYPGGLKPNPSPVDLPSEAELGPLPLIDPIAVCLDEIEIHQRPGENKLDTLSRLVLLCVLHRFPDRKDAAAYLSMDLQKLYRWASDAGERRRKRKYATKPWSPERRLAWAENREKNRLAREARKARTETRTA